MSKAPISLCMIVRDEPLLEQAVASVRDHVAEVCIVDTGSTDGTDRVAMRLADKFARYHASNDDRGRLEDFSAARNASFALAAQPWTMWMDADDVLVGAENLPELFELLLRQDCEKDSNVALVAPYEYAHDQSGHCVALHRRERIVPTGAFRWDKPVHEHLVPIDGGAVRYVQSDLVTWRHRRTKSSGDRNLRILRAYAAKHGVDDPWTMFNLGWELCARGEHHEGLEHLQRFAGEGRHEADQRAIAALKVSEIWRFYGDTDQALEWAAVARQIRPHWGEGYFAIARVHMALAAEHADERQATIAWSNAAEHLRAGLACAPTSTSRLIDPQERSRAHEMLAQCLQRLGKDDEAALELHRAAALRPWDQYLAASVGEVRRHKARKQLGEALVRARECGALDEHVAEAFEGAISDPEAFKRRMIGAAASQHRSPAVALPSGALRVAFSCGHSPEPFDPEIIEREGRGGSETAVVEIAERLARLGHDVRVHCDCGREGRHGGVLYQRAAKVFASAPADVLVAWRDAALLEPHRGPVSARTRVLWAHDLGIANMTHARSLLADRIVAVSKWHARHLSKQYNLHSSHAVVAYNGVDLAKFQVHRLGCDSKSCAGCVTLERDPKRVVYSSSPDRGLGEMLALWPIVRDSEPQATLHVYYGFDSAIACWRGRHDELMKLEALKARAESMRDQGVVLHGRVSQASLAADMLRSGVWAYPAWLGEGESGREFHETCCIGALEARAAGLFPVTVGCGALEETAYACGEPYRGDQGSRERFAARLVAAMCTTDDARELIAKSAEYWTWDRAAGAWDSILRNAVERSRQGLLVPYQPHIVPVAA